MREMQEMDRKRNAKWLLAGAVGLPVLLAACNQRLKVISYTIQTRKLIAPIRLAVLADLHSCNYGTDQHELVDTVLALKPNAILMVGDIVDDRLPEMNAWITISRLARVHPLFFVVGNHELWGNTNRICQEVEALGGVPLRGRGVYLHGQVGQVVAIFGIDYVNKGEEDKQLEHLGNMITGDSFSILLAHQPERIGVYQQYPFDLVVSGHTHGGQWRLPMLCNGIYAPGQGVFPRYAGGLYTVGDTMLLVSRGLARESTLLPRFFNRPEVVLVDLLPEESESGESENSNS